MQTTINQSTKPALLKSVMNYTHPGVVSRLVKENGFSNDEAESVFKDTLRFLYLCGAYGGGLAPSTKIDEGWHSFILYTSDYMSFCNSFFNSYIHHYPNPEDYKIEDGAKSISRTLNIATKVFGQLSENWKYKKIKNILVSDCLASPCSDNPCTSCSPTTNCQSSTSDCSN